MEKVILTAFAALCCTLATNAQNDTTDIYVNYAYDEVSKMWWKKDSVYFTNTNNTNLDLNQISIYINSPFGSSMSVTVQNNTDNMLAVKWSDVYIETKNPQETFCSLTPSPRIDKTKLEQTQHIVSGDIVTVYLVAEPNTPVKAFLGQLGTMLSFRKIKELYWKNYEPVPIEAIVTIPVIYKDKLVRVKVSKKGIYSGKRKK